MLINLLEFKPYRATPRVFDAFLYNSPRNPRACIKLTFEVDTFQYPMAKGGGLI